MPRNNKRYISGTVIEVGFRAEEGLPLPANECIVDIIKGISAQAQLLYPVTICALLWMANHTHMILVVRNPEDVVGFVGYVKRELAHAVNRMMGRRQHTVWQEGYDSPILGSPEVVIERLVYMFTNPQKANLEETIDQYPHFSTWREFLHGGGSIPSHRVYRHSIPYVPEGRLEETTRTNLREALRSQTGASLTLAIEPDAWLACFPETENADAQAVKAEVVKQVREQEANYRQSRVGPPLSHKALREQAIRLSHRPKKHLMRMIVIERDRKRRRAIILWHKEDQERAREIRRLRKCGDNSGIPPPGFFLTGGVLLANILVAATPLVLYCS